MYVDGESKSVIFATMHRICGILHTSDGAAAHSPLVCESLYPPCVWCTTVESDLSLCVGGGGRFMPGCSTFTCTPPHSAPSPATLVQGAPVPSRATQEGVLGCCHMAVRRHESRVWKYQSHPRSKGRFVPTAPHHLRASIDTRNALPTHPPYRRSVGGHT